VTHEFKKKQLLKPRIEGINKTAKTKEARMDKLETDAHQLASFFFINMFMPIMCGVKTLQA